MQNSLRSSSSIASVTLRSRLSEGLALAQMYLAKRRQRVDFSEFLKFTDEYNHYAQKYLGKDLHAVKIVEVGYGARPQRISWLHSLGIDVTGIDLDAPVMNLNLAALFKVVQKNGFERTLKSAARQILIGQKEWKDLAGEFKLRHPDRKFDVPVDRMLVGNAADPAIWNRIGSIQMVYSEVVFEHIPLDVLPRIMDQIHRALSPDGIALIRPHIFTGISGGHNVEWYPHTLSQPRQRKSQPWEHLRENRFPANTYLNRAGYNTYVELFARNFEILDVDKGNTSLGKEFLDEKTRIALSQYTEEELMLNEVLFVLRPLPRPLD